MNVDNLSKAQRALRSNLRNAYVCGTLHDARMAKQTNAIHVSEPSVDGLTRGFVNQCLDEIIQDIDR